MNRDPILPGPAAWPLLSPTATTMQPVLHSLLETDLYKFTMWQAMLHRQPQTQAEYIFICRNAHDYPLTHLIAEINEQLDHLCSLRFQPDELAYLRGLRFIKSDFVDFLRIFQFQRDFIEGRDNQGTLEIVARGPQVHVMALGIGRSNALFSWRWGRDGVSRALGRGAEWGLCG